MNGREYQLEETNKESRANDNDSKDEDDEYEEDFEQYHDKSDDEEALAELQKKRINGGKTLSNANMSVTGSAFPLKI